MSQKNLDTCPNCTTDLLKNTKAYSIKQYCKTCQYTQHVDSRYMLEALHSSLLEMFYKKGISSCILKNHTIELDLALRADGLLPLLIEECNKNNEKIPFKVIKDNNARLIGYRVIYQYDKGCNHTTYLKVLERIIDSLFAMTRHENYDISQDTIQFDFLINGHEVKNNVLQNKTSNKVVSKKMISNHNYNVIKSMTKNIKSEVCFGQLEQLKDKGAKLKPVPDISKLVSTLYNEFPWFSNITDIFCRELTSRSQGCGYFHLPPVLILGDPGVGKTAYCSRMAELSNVPYRILSVAGSMSNQILAGTERGFDSGKPSLAVQTILEAQTANPLIIIDELDKAGGSERNGDIKQTLLGMLEPASSRHWYDNFLMGHADLSKISWVATANSIAHLPNTILSRFRVVHAQKPQTEHYPQIVWETRRRFIGEYRISENWLPLFSTEEWSWLEQYFTSPRKAKRATEELLKEMLNSGLGKKLH